MSMAKADPLRMILYEAPYNRHYTRGKRKRGLVVNISNEMLSYTAEWPKQIGELAAFKQLVRAHTKAYGLRRDSKIPE